MAYLTEAYTDWRIFAAVLDRPQGWHYGQHVKWVLHGLQVRPIHMERIVLTIDILVDDAVVWTSNEHIFTDEMASYMKISDFVNEALGEVRIKCGEYQRMMEIP